MNSQRNKWLENNGTAMNERYVGFNITMQRRLHICNLVEGFIPFEFISACVCAHTFRCTVLVVIVCWCVFGWRLQSHRKPLSMSTHRIWRTDFGCHSGSHWMPSCQNSLMHFKVEIFYWIWTILEMGTCNWDTKAEIYMRYLHNVQCT